MATTEQLLISLGIDPSSIKQIVSDYQNLKKQIEGDPIKLDIEVANAAGELRNVGAEAEKVFQRADHEAAIFEDGIMDINEGLGELKGSLIAISGAAALIGGLGFLQAADESTALARANVILGDNTEDLAKKQADLRKIADEVGLTYAETAAALFDVASAGFEGEEAVDAIRAAAQAAVPAGIDLQTAFNAIATAQNNFGITSEEAADKLVRIADVTRGTLANVSQALGRIAPTASSVGISLDEVGAAFASITNKGESAEEASTLLFNAINKFLAPSDEAAKILAQLGIETGDAAFQTQSLSEKLEIVARAAAKGGTELSKVFDIRASRAIRAITSDMDGFRDNLTKIANSSGRTEQGLEDFFKLAGPQFTKLKKQIINVATAIGTDLLGIIVPLTTAFGNFITENQGLITILTELALVVGGLAAAWLAYKVIAVQVKAAGKVLEGVSKVLSVALSDENTAVKETISAWFNRIKIQAKAAKTKIGEAIGVIVKWLRTENATIWLGIKAWAARLGMGLVRALDALGSALVFVVQWIRKETAAMWGATTATRVQTLTTNSLRANLNLLAGAFGKNIGQASKLATGFGLIGAAIIGAKIGAWINDWFELEKATREYVETGRASVESILTNIVTFGGLSRARSRAVAAMEATNKLTAQQSKILDEDSAAMRKFARFTDAGLNAQRAFSAALGNARAELGALIAIRGRGIELTVEEAKQIIRLREEIKTTTEERRRLEAETKTAAEAISAANATLLKTQDAWTAAVKRTTEAYDKLVAGALADSSTELAKFEADVTLTAKRLGAASTEFQDAQRTLNIQQFFGGGTDEAKKKIEEALATMNEKRAEIVGILDKLDKDIAVVNAKILANGKAYIEDIKAQADAEVASRRRAVEDLIAEDKRLLAETKTTLDDLIDARKKAVAAVERFSARLQDAAIRRQDPRLLEIIKLEREFATIIKQGVRDQKQRTEAIKDLGLELDRLSAATTEEIRLQEELLEAQKATEEARADPEAADEFTEALEKQRKIEEKLATITAKRQERSAKAEKVIADAIAGSTDAIKTFADREAKITAIEAKREAAQARLELIADALVVAQGKIEASLKEQVKQAKELIKAQLTAVAIAATITTTPEGERRGATSDFNRLINEARQKLAAAIEEVQDFKVEDISKNIQDTANAVEDLDGVNAVTADWLFELKNNLNAKTSEIEARNKVIVPAAAEATAAIIDLPMKLEAPTIALEGMLDSTNDLADGLEEFADTTVDTMGKAKNRMDALTTSVAENTERLRSLTGAGGGANGLPQ